MEVVKNKKKITRYKLLDFQEGVKERHAIVVPKGSTLRKIISLHDGIYAIYEIASLDSEIINIVNTIAEDIESHFFCVIGKDGIIPDNAEYVDVIDMIVEDPDSENQGDQKVVLFPIYKFKS